MAMQIAKAMDGTTLQDVRSAFPCEQPASPYDRLEGTATCVAVVAVGLSVVWMLLPAFAPPPSRTTLTR
jgi:hypothetical protein